MKESNPSPPILAKNSGRKDCRI